MNCVPKLAFSCGYLFLLNNFLFSKPLITSTNLCYIILIKVNLKIFIKKKKKQLMEHGNRSWHKISIGSCIKITSDFVSVGGGIYY